MPTQESDTHIQHILDSYRHARIEIDRYKKPNWKCDLFEIEQIIMKRWGLDHLTLEEQEQINEYERTLALQSFDTQFRQKS